MDLEEKVQKAKVDDSVRNELLEDYFNFALSSAGKTLGRHITQEDDACSVAMLAFNEAIDKFDASKGRFLSFAELTVESRLKDWLRKEYREKSRTIPFSSIGGADEDEPEFDVEDTRAGISDTAIEIGCLNDELKKYDISFFELPRYSPKSFKTKSGCQKIIRFILGNCEVLKSVKCKHTLPAKQIMEALKVNEKLLERHRKYIIACVIILDGEYEMISEYLKFAKEGGAK